MDMAEWIEEIQELRVVRFPHPILCQQARPVDVARIDSPTGKRILEALQIRMHDLCGKLNLAGIAAPQLGLKLRIVYLPAFTELFINPVLECSGGFTVAMEGCASLPGLQFPVRRYARVRLREERNPASEVDEITGARDFTARVLQHEVDHLNGMLTPDYSGVKSHDLREMSEAAWAKLPVEKKAHYAEDTWERKSILDKIMWNLQGL